MNDSINYLQAMSCGKLSEQKLVQVLYQVTARIAARTKADKFRTRSIRFGGIVR